MESPAGAAPKAGRGGNRNGDSQTRDSALRVASAMLYLLRIRCGQAVVGVTSTCGGRSIRKPSGQILAAGAQELKDPIALR
jgi:hypothetical protein